MTAMIWILSTAQCKVGRHDRCRDSLCPCDCHELPEGAWTQFSR